MARAKSGTVKRSGDIVLVQPPAAASPVRRRASSGIRRRRAPKRRSSGAVGKYLGAPKAYRNRVIGAGVGGALFGFVMKTWGKQIPTIPALGRAGTIATAIAIWEPRNQIVQDVGIAAATIAGYSMGTTGAVVGDDDDEHGLAAEA